MMMTTTTMIGMMMDGMMMNDDCLHFDDRRETELRLRIVDIIKRERHTYHSSLDFNKIDNLTSFVCPLIESCIRFYDKNIPSQSVACVLTHTTPAVRGSNGKDKISNFTLTRLLICPK